MGGDLNARAEDERGPQARHVGPGNLPRLAARMGAGEIDRDDAAGPWNAGRRGREDGGRGLADMPEEAEAPPLALGERARRRTEGIRHITAAGQHAEFLGFPGRNRHGGNKHTGHSGATGQGDLSSAWANE